MNEKELNENELDSVNGGTVIGPGSNNDLNDDPDIFIISPSIPPIKEPLPIIDQQKKWPM